MTPALSARNPMVRRLRRLSAKRTEREVEGAFVVEGWKLVDEARSCGLVFEELFVVEAGLSRLPPGLTRVHVLDEGVLAGALDTSTPQGIAGIVTMPRCDAEPLEAGSGPELVLAGVADPGNAGALVRSAEASGCSAVRFCDGSVDPFAPKCVRASAGSIFRVPVVSEGEGVDVLERLGDRGVRRLGTSAHAGDTYDGLDLASPFALVLGSETHGLRDELTARLDGIVHIPMAGELESLNVGIAGSIVLFEAARQRRANR
ncbi:MAG: TrmH family RNA methyltransferase [Acidimicrobiales bacterium]